jgi:hypothetical protein
MHGAEMFLEEHKFIEACNVFLREIELHLDEISDFDKDKHKILSLFEKFKDIELNLYQRYYYNQLLIRTNERIIPCIIGSQHDICFRNWCQKSVSEILEAKKILRLISELQERKSKVEKRIKELGIKFCSKKNKYF